MQDTPKNFHKKLLGKVGEKGAEKHLKKLGYKILEKNFTTKIGEIDLIALDGETLVFIEVKTRSSENYGAPSQAVNKLKQEKYYLVATEYLKMKGLFDKECRFDVVEVIFDQINVIKDAFSR